MQDPKFLIDLEARYNENLSKMKDLEEKYQIAFKSLMQLILNQYQNETNDNNEL